jgi:hypothetical protein
MKRRVCHARGHNIAFMRLICEFLGTRGRIEPLGSFNGDDVQISMFGDIMVTSSDVVCGRE